MRRPEQLSILVAEDEETTSSIIGAHLESVGYDVRHVSDGLLLMEALRDWIPDLILLDIGMPVQDGLSCLDTIKNQEKTRNIPVVMLTANGQSDNVIRAAQIGAQDFIVKPFTKKILLDRVSLHTMKLDFPEVQQILENCRFDDTSLTLESGLRSYRSQRCKCYQTKNLGRDFVVVMGDRHRPQELITMPEKKVKELAVILVQGVYWTPIWPTVHSRWMPELGVDQFMDDQEFEDLINSLMV